jgi:hypothetical protein
MLVWLPTFPEDVGQKSKSTPARRNLSTRERGDQATKRAAMFPTEYATVPYRGFFSLLGEWKLAHSLPWP